MRRRPDRRTRRARCARVATVAAAVLAACKFSAGVGGDAASDADEPPDASACTAISVECASAGVLRSCSGPGATAVDLPCPWGCRITPGAHCARIDPSANALNPGDVAYDADLLEVTLAPGTTIDGDDGRIGDGLAPSGVREAGTGIVNGIFYEQRGAVAVFRMNKLQIDGALTLAGSNAIALAVDGDVIINGVIDAQGGCLVTNPGPGGFRGGIKGVAGDGPGLSGGRGAAGDREGGGGGGYGGSGGSGGNTPFAAGGVPHGGPLIPELAGGAGGGGGQDGGNSGVGGGGGGALQIVSNARIVILAGGGINAGGCGGKTGTGGNDGGGGGGAGGTILLEAKTVEISGTLAVNGGGGGGGDGNTGAGSNGALSRTRAAGSAGGAVAAGGDGAAGEVMTGSNGVGGNGGPDDGGGGGGGVGRIRITTASGSAIITGTLSPGLGDPGTTCTQGEVTIEPE